MSFDFTEQIASKTNSELIDICKNSELYQLEFVEQAKAELTKRNIQFEELNSYNAVTENQTLTSYNENLFKVKYASLTIRIIAYFLDFFVVLIFLLIIEILLSDGTLSNSIEKQPLIILLVWTLYYGLTESSDMEGTIGKRICGIKVVDEKGNSLTFRKATLRYLAITISLLPLGFGIWSIASNKKKQGWHDMLLGCYVVKRGSDLTGLGVEQDEDDDNTPIFSL